MTSESPVSPSASGFRRAAFLATLSLVTLASMAPAHAETPRQNTVQFSATATREVAQDELTVTLEVVKEASQAAEVQSELKRILEGALAEARVLTQGVSPDALSAQTGGFQLYPRYGSNGRISGWQGSAQVILSGNDAAKVSQAAGKLQPLNITQVRYGLSRALRDKHEASLTTEAISQFRARARQIATDFGMKGHTLGTASVSSTDPNFEGRPVAMMAMQAKSSAAPMADAALPVMPGKGVLTITVSGEVVLTP